MKKRSFLSLLSLLVVLSAILAQAQVKEDDDDDDLAVQPSGMKPADKQFGALFECPYEKDFQRPQKVDGYKLRLVPGSKAGDARCRAILISPKGKPITVAEDWALTVDKISGTDINADGKPELVLDGYSGDAYCCYTYTIVSLRTFPRVLCRFRNKMPVAFQKEPDGATLIRAQDGVFDYFLLPHSDAVIPVLVLKMEGWRLVDVSAQFPQQYDEQIRRARSELTAEDLERFRQASYHDKMFINQVATVHRVLTIVLNYLYSGREEKAWQALSEFWPPSDQARVKSLIIERRERGLLQHLN